jgi:glycosyltransferase involved in cell wall biosynthesis
MPFARGVSVRQPNIGLVTNFGAGGGERFVLNLVTILSSLSAGLYVLSPAIGILQGAGKTHLFPVAYKLSKNILSQAVNDVTFQLRISYRLARLVGKVDLWVFFEGTPMSLPMLVAKLFRGRVALALAGYLEKEGEFRKAIIYKPLILLKKIDCRLADRIILYSPRLIKGWQLERHRGKILIAHEQLLDFDKFRVQKPFNARDDLVGYIGRLSEPKGILNFLEAIPMMLKKGNNLRFLIGGDGQLRERVEEFLSKDNMDKKVTFVGWIPHDQLPKYLNEVKLLVLPSYTEGLPDIVLEAMACGTPVLATPVGAAPDVIKDGETGFTMEDNSPQCIAENVARALNRPDLEQIARNGRALVEREFTYEKAVEAWRDVLHSLG